MDEYHELFYREFLNAKSEYEHLLRLFQDVNWYNFEVSCRAWKYPWHQSSADSGLTLCGVRVETRERRGHYNEKVTWPVYYNGPVYLAPPVPAAILMSDIKDALELVLYYKDLCSAPYDWAPGGDAWQTLMRSGWSARAYEERRLSNSTAVAHDDRCEARGGVGHVTCGGLERAAEAQPQATPADVL